MVLPCRQYVLMKILYGGFVLYLLFLGLALDGGAFNSSYDQEETVVYNMLYHGWSERRTTDQWQNVDPRGDTLVFSAHIIQSKTAKGGREIRVVAVIDSQGGIGKRIARAGWKCLELFVENGQKTQTLLEVSRVYVLPDHHNTRYRPALITCSLNDTHRAPEVISIVSRRFNHLMPLNYLPVHQNAFGSTQIRQFTMCLSPLHGILQTPEDLVQYFELNRLLGADHFVIYNHTLKSPVNNAIINYYKEMGLAEVLPWNLPSDMKHPKDIWYYAQVAMLSDCMMRNRGVSRYVVTTDLDEYIIPLKGTQWKDILANEPVSCEYSFKSLAFNEETMTKAGDLFSLSSQIRLTRARDVIDNRYRTKYIVDPVCVETPGIHFTMNISAPNGVDAVRNVSTSEGLVYHYNAKLAIGETMKDQSMLKYGSELSTNVKHILDEVLKGWDYM